MKKFISVLLATAAVFAAVTAVSAESITVNLNGQAVDFPDAKPFIDENDRAQTPMRAIAEAAGLKVSWEEETRTVKLYSNDLECNFVIGAPTATVKFFNKGDSGYSVINMDTDAIIAGERTYIPVNYLAKAMGMTADWDAETQTVNIRKTTEADLSERFPLDAFFPESHFANGYTDNEVPEALANALSNSSVVYGEGKPMETIIEAYDNSVDVSDKVYKQEFHFDASAAEPELDNLAVETSVFGNCSNLAVNVTVDSEPVWITVSISKIDADNRISYCCREWHADALDKSVTVDFNNLDSSAKYFVQVSYTYPYTPEIKTVNGIVSVAAY